MLKIKLVLSSAVMALTVVGALPALAVHGGSPSPELTVVGQLNLQGLGIPQSENVTDV